MPIYKFSGVDASGSRVAGEREATNKQVLQANLRKERVANIVIKEKGKEFTPPTPGYVCRKGRQTEICGEVSLDLSSFGYYDRGARRGRTAQIRCSHF